MVSASISIQYIGSLETESGFWAGSHIYGTPLETLTTDDIENGSWLKHARPSEGLRFCYLPQENNDFDFYAVNNAESGAIGGKDVSKHSPYQAIMTTDSGTRSFARNAPCIAIYYKGMSANTNNQMRIDIVRRYNGLPKRNFRDVIATRKPNPTTDADKTK